MSLISAAKCAPVETPSNDPALPAGYYYDDVNAEVLLQAHVQDGRIVLPSGASYAVLVSRPAPRS